MSTENKGFWIEFDPPLKNKVDVLREFVEANELYGNLDRNYIVQALAQLDGLHISKLRMHIVKLKQKKRECTLAITIGHKSFDGKGPTIEDALIKMLENTEDWIHETLGFENIESSIRETLDAV